MITLNPIKIINNIFKEYEYFTNRPWTLKKVGNFWDTVEDYDDYNKKLYPYFKRFTNSEKLFRKFYYKIKNKKLEVLDIQTRSGVGTFYWSKILKNSNFTCVDFSDGLLEKAKKRLTKKKNCSFKKVLSEKFKLKKKFDIIFCYETVEHVYNYKKFIASLKSHLKKNGYIIITCPNVSWEIVHWLTAIIEFNHSEGPHRFISLSKINETFKKLDLNVVAYNTTIFLPFNNKYSIKIDEYLTKKLPRKFKELFMLRHSFILKSLK